MCASPWWTPPMQDYDPSTYGDRIAAVYDDWYSARMDPTTAVAQLGEYASGGRALELDVGTGRVAIPLAATGVTVVGIDASEAMVERLRVKPGGENIEVVLGDFADVKVPWTF